MALGVGLTYLLAARPADCLEAPIGTPSQDDGKGTRTLAASTGYDLASLPSPSSRARMMAWARSATCSLMKMFETWLRTVLGLR